MLSDRSSHEHGPDDLYVITFQTPFSALTDDDDGDDIMIKVGQPTFSISFLLLLVGS